LEEETFKGQYNKEISNQIINNLKRKLVDLENKTSRLQSLNEIFLDLLKKQQKQIISGNPQQQMDNYDLILHKYRKKYDYLDIPSNPINNEFRKMGRSNSQLDMFNIKDIKYYKEPIKMMQDQLKAYIFQSTLDRRRDEYLLNEQINDIKSEVKNRLLRLENQNRLQLYSLANSIKTGEGYNNFSYLANRITASQRERENFEQYLNNKLNGISNINQFVNHNSNKTYFDEFSNNNNYNSYNNRYMNEMNNMNNNNMINDNINSMNNMSIRNNYALDDI
jgi:hypothetical protein